MSLTSDDDLSIRSLEEIRRSHSENRAWSKELRARNTALVNSRLTHEISLAEYAERRTLINEQAAECKRLGLILFGEIESRRGRARSGAPIEGPSAVKVEA